MGFIAWIVFGIIAGFIASKLVNKQGEGVLIDCVLGIVGAVVGGYLMSYLTGAPYQTRFFDPYSWIIAIFGAVIVLFIYHAVFGRRATY